MKRTLSGSWFCDSIWRICLNIIRRRQGGAFFSEMAFPGVVGNVLTERNVLGLIVLFIFICLCPPALHTLPSITPFPLSLPSFRSLGGLIFPGSFTILTQLYPSNSSVFTLWNCCRFFVCCLCSCVCFSSWYPGMLLRTETKVGLLGFATCRV